MHIVTHSHITAPACRPSRSEASSCQCFWFESANGATRAAWRLRVWSAEIFLPLSHPTNSHTYTRTSPLASTVPILYKYPSTPVVITLFLFALLLSLLIPSCQVSLIASVRLWLSNALFLLFILMYSFFSFTLTFSIFIPLHYYSLYYFYHNSLIFLPKHMIKLNMSYSQSFLISISVIYWHANWEQ